MIATVLQAYRFALDVTPRQQRALASHCGAARYAYNWGLQLVQERLEQRTTDPSVRVPWTLAELRREWNRAKHQVAPWWPDNSNEAYNSGLDALVRALKNCSDSRNGCRRGPQSDSRAARPSTARGPLAGSAPAPSGCWLTVSTSSSHGSGSSGRMSRPASWQPDSAAAGPYSCPSRQPPA